MPELSSSYKACLSGLCVLFIILAIVVLVISGSRESLNQNARAGTITGATPAFLGNCPTDPEWETVSFTNGTYCIEPGSIGLTDNLGNLIGAELLPCTGEMKTINGHQYCVKK